MVQVVPEQIADAEKRVICQTNVSSAHFHENGGIQIRSKKEKGKVWVAQNQENSMEYY